MPRYSIVEILFPFLRYSLIFTLHLHKTYSRKENRTIRTNRITGILALALTVSGEGLFERSGPSLGVEDAYFDGMRSRRVRPGIPGKNVQRAVLRRAGRRAQKC